VIVSLWTAPTPGLVAAILHWRWTWPVARLGLSSAFLLGGLAKLWDFRGAIAEQEGFGLAPGWLWAGLTILVELGGSALLISGCFVWLGAGGLGVMTAVAMVKADAFWTLKGRERLAAANTFFEHIGLIAGLVMAALIAG